MLEIKSGDYIVDHKGNDILGKYLFVGKIKDKYYATLPDMYLYRESVLLFEIATFLHNDGDSILEVVKHFDIKKDLAKFALMKIYPVIIGKFETISLNDIEYCDLKLYTYEEVKNLSKNKYVAITGMKLDFRSNIVKEQLFLLNTDIS